MKKLLTLIVACAAVTNPRTCNAQETPALPVLKVGHVGHDHHLALYVAALNGDRFQREYGVWLKELSPRELYELIESNRPLARLQFIKVEGAATMPAAMSRGEIQIGLGGINAIARFVDNGEPIKIICPLQTDGDMLVMAKASPITNWASFVQATKKPGKPLQIGYKGAAAVAKVIFEGALKAEGISYGYDATKTDARVILVNFAAEASPVPLLESGALDGFVMNQPAAAVAVRKGAGRVVSDLSELPPAGKWRNHPCCCIAAKESVLAEHPEPVRALLKTVLLATQLINQDKQFAAECASRWTKTELAVERASVPTVNYVAEPIDAWRKGFNTWSEMMQEIGFFTGRLKSFPPDEVMSKLCDFTLCNAAAGELRKTGLLK